MLEQVVGGLVAVSYLSRPRSPAAPAAWLSAGTGGVQGGSQLLDRGGGDQEPPVDGADDTAGSDAEDEVERIVGGAAELFRELLHAQVLAVVHGVRVGRRLLRWGGLKLLLPVKPCRDECGVDLAGDVALEAAHDLGLAEPLGGASGDVVLGALVGAHAD